MEKKLKIGMIGAGFMGQLAHLDNYQEIENCEIIGLAELRPNLREKVSKKYHIPNLYNSHIELLKNPDIDAVVAITPRQLTFSVARDCLNAGKHLLTEKPMACTLNQAQILVNIAKEKNLLYSVGYMKRYDEGVQTAKKILAELIQNKKLGEIIFVRATCMMGDSFAKAGGHLTSDEKIEISVSLETDTTIAPDWVPDCYKMDFAGYLNTYSHNTNLLRYLFNKNPSVQYVNFNRMKGRIALLNFGPFVTSLETGRSEYHYWHEEIQIFFEKGHLTLKTPPPLLKNVVGEVNLYEAHPEPKTTLFNTGWSWAFKRQAEAFVNNILENSKSISSGEDSMEDITLVENMWNFQIDQNPNKDLSH